MIGGSFPRFRRSRSGQVLECIERIGNAHGSPLVFLFNAAF